MLSTISTTCLLQTQSGWWAVEQLLRVVQVRVPIPHHDHVVCTNKQRVVLLLMYHLFKTQGSIGLLDCYESAFTHDIARTSQVESDVGSPTLSLLPVHM